MELELLRTRRAKEELEMAADDEQLCCVCMDRPKMVMFEPCCHVSVCKQCAPRIAQCPRRRAKGGRTSKCGASVGAYLVQPSWAAVELPLLVAVAQPQTRNRPLNPNVQTPAAAEGVSPWPCAVVPLFGFDLELSITHILPLPPPPAYNHGSGEAGAFNVRRTHSSPRYHLEKHRRCPGGSPVGVFATEFWRRGLTPVKG